MINVKFKIPLTQTAVSKHLATDAAPVLHLKFKILDFTFKIIISSITHNVLIINYLKMNIFVIQKILDFSRVE